MALKLDCATEVKHFLLTPLSLGILKGCEPGVRGSTWSVSFTSKHWLLLLLAWFELLTSYVPHQRDLLRHTHTHRPVAVVVDLGLPGLLLVQALVMMDNRLGEGLTVTTFLQRFLLECLTVGAFILGQLSQVVFAVKAHSSVTSCLHSSVQLLSFTPPQPWISLSVVLWISLTRTAGAHSAYTIMG